MTNEEFEFWEKALLFSISAGSAGYRLGQRGSYLYDMNLSADDFSNHLLEIWKKKRAEVVDSPKNKKHKNFRDYLATEDETDKRLEDHICLWSYNYHVKSENNYYSECGFGAVAKHKKCPLCLRKVVIDPVKR